MPAYLIPWRTIQNSSFVSHSVTAPDKSGGVGSIFWAIGLGGVPGAPWQGAQPRAKCPAPRSTIDRVRKPAGGSIEAA